jgi:hypothetical protein
LSEEVRYLFVAALDRRHLFNECLVVEHGVL